MNTKTSKPALILNIHFLQFLVSFALLANEILLTRLFSAKFMKYFSLLAISLAMAGLGLGGIATFLRSEKIKYQGDQYLFRHWLLFSCSLVLTPLYLFFFAVPSFFASLDHLFSVLLFSFVCLIPFFWGGLLLSYNYQFKAGERVRIYFWDLLGGACGSVAAFLILNLTDGLSALLLVACISQLGLMVWSMRRRPEKSSHVAKIGLAVLGVLFFSNHLFQYIRLEPPKMRRGGNEIEIWSEFGLTTVAQRSNYKGTGISPSKPFLEPEIFKFISHDYNSSTMAVDANYDAEQLQKLRNQINAFPFLFKKHARALVLGSGGGKDVFTGLISGAEHITAVEFNRIIANNIMQGDLKEFSGDIYNHDRVDLVVQEARSFLNTHEEKYDVILPVMGSTPSMIAAGCYTFSTEYLQTFEAYQKYFDHLSPEGIFAFPCSFKQSKLAHQFQPQYRILATIREVLRHNGLDPRQHMLAVGGAMWSSFKIYDYTAMVMFSPSPFSKAEVEQARQIARNMGFDVIYSPYSHQEGLLLTKFLSSGDDQVFYDLAPINIKPVHDDRPYYYFQAKKLSLWDVDDESQYLQHISSSVKIYLFYIALLFFVPVIMMRPQWGFKKATKVFQALVYFGIIGTSFIILELTFMQRINFLLGIHTYGVLVTIAVFTLSMGLGSLVAGSTKPAHGRWWLLGAVVLMGISLAYWQVIWPELCRHAAGKSLSYKLFLSGASLVVPGFAAGFPFVLGLKRFSIHFPEGNAWVWAINAAATTVGAVLVTLLWVGYGFSQTTLFGFLGYALAFLLI